MSFTKPNYPIILEHHLKIRAHHKNEQSFVLGAEAVMIRT